MCVRAVAWLLVKALGSVKDLHRSKKGSIDVQCETVPYGDRAQGMVCMRFALFVPVDITRMGAGRQPADTG